MMCPADRKLVFLELQLLEGPDHHTTGWYYATNDAERGGRE